MSCKQQSGGQLDCDYKVGQALRFTIAGVGQEDAAITFFRVDQRGDYYASVGVLHGCVIVKPGEKNTDRTFPMAFVSPQNGKVYRDWQSCDRANKR